MTFHPNNPGMEWNTLFNGSVGNCTCDVRKLTQKAVGDIHLTRWPRQSGGLTGSNQRTDLCLSVAMPVVPAVWINRMEGCLSLREAHPQRGWRAGALNVNVIQIYGRQIDGCRGYGGADTVRAIEMRIDKCSLVLF